MQAMHKIWFLLLFAIQISGCGFGSDNVPTDDELIEHFHENRESFEKFVVMFSNVEGLSFLQIGRVGSKKPLRSNVVGFPLSVERTLEEMNDVLKVELVKALSTEGEDLEVINQLAFFYYRDRGAKGFAHFRFENQNLIEDDLNKYDSPANEKFPPNTRRVYREIGDGWFLFSG